MIGGVNGTVDFSDPQDNPDGSVILPIYTYNPDSFGYVEEASIESGKGYWVLAIQECTLTLSVASPAPKKLTPKALYASEADWTVPILIKTGKGIREIALGVQADASDGFDPYIDVALPPSLNSTSSSEASFVINDKLVDHLSKDIRKPSKSIIWNMDIVSVSGDYGASSSGESLKSSLPSLAKDEGEIGHWGVKGHETPSPQSSNAPSLLNPSSLRIIWDVSSIPADVDMVLQTEATIVDMRTQNMIDIPIGEHRITIRLRDRVPAKPDLLQNYPNPFNPETWIPYQLSKDADVSIRIYNSAGYLVRTLNPGHNMAGYYKSKDKAAYWDGNNEAGERVSSGIYFYTIHAGEYTETRKMIMVR